MNRLLMIGNCSLALFLCRPLQGQGLAEEKPEFVRARSLATNICAQCHLFPGPELLDRTTWRDQIKPMMRRIMGVAALEADPSTNARVLIQEWNSIWNDYYLRAAPE